MEFNTRKVAVIGLGYVGLPLAVEFGKKYKTLGFDINKSRIQELISGHDSTLEVDEYELKEVKSLKYSYDVNDLESYDFYVVTVPTPINESKQPDLEPLVKASKMLGAVVKKGDVIVYESTVYPGATEEVCIPILEEISGLKFNEDFYAGYSPERINPGDKEHRVTNILKVTSGSTPEAAALIDNVYKSIINAGTYKASSIKVAEAAKVIENTQRDVNIALINELSIIFNKLGIDTLEVLEAAGTKWNFLPFRPGLVGGHCIGVDPYYLTHKAQSVGYHPEIILAGRRLNDGMGQYVVSQLIKKMLMKKIHVEGAKVLIMGFSFKENCPDIRNTRVIDVVKDLEEYNVSVDIYDPWVSDKDAFDEYGLELMQNPDEGSYDAVVVAVAHKEFRELGYVGVEKLLKGNSVVFDLKYVLDKSQSDIRL